MPVDTPYVFLTPKSFVRQSLDEPPRNIERSNVDHGHRLKATQQQKIQNDTIASWKPFKTFCYKLQV